MDGFDLGLHNSNIMRANPRSLAARQLPTYALYGEALTRIRKENLINKTNGKAMMVTIEFEKDGLAYKIERGRKPNVMKFFVDDKEQEAKDESQGDSRETQVAIDTLLGMSHEMFKHIVALNTYTEPFLNQRSNDHRVIIEQLLGITMLSEKADALKEQYNETKKLITQEQYRIDAVLNANRRIEEQIESLQRRQTLWVNKNAEDIARLQTAYDELSHLDIDVELAAHKALTAYNQAKSDINSISSAIKRAQLDQGKEERLIAKLTTEIESLEDHKCHTCGQDFHDEAHAEVIARKRAELGSAMEELSILTGQITELEAALQELGDPGTPPKVYYDAESEAFEHKSSMANILQQLTSKQQDTDPYAEQIEEMRTKGVEEVKYDVINELNSVKDHQDFLLKLLTNKDSFIRKKIIDQNLSHLNARLSYYLDQIGLPHTVKFNNDLTVSIEELGRELDFDNLSRGERTRLILSLSWSFRDVWESLYQNINLLFIDELVDNGLDANGVENTLAILKKTSREGNKSIWLVSHRDELVGRVNQVFKVVKENGYTSYSTEAELV